MQNRMRPIDFTRFAARLEQCFAAFQSPDLEARRGFGEEWFNAMALDLFALHHARNEPFRRLCEARKISPRSVEHWSQIPAMPSAAFKEFDVSCLEPGERPGWFQSSGTTTSKQGRHYHNELSLRVYDESAWAWLGHQLRDGPAAGGVSHDVLALAPAPGDAPHSSLVRMFETARTRLGAGADCFCGAIGPDGAWVLDGGRCERALGSLGANPVLVMGAAFSYVHLLDLPGIRPVALPSGSIVFETGGYKGRSRTVPKDRLHRELCGFFGVESPSVLCEYGMSELSSQAYEKREDAEAGVFHFPPWARARLVSPETAKAADEGEIGMIEVVDLANIASVLAVRTEDLGRRRGVGFEFLGRASDAEPRGCSLRLAEHSPA